MGLKLKFGAVLVALEKRGDYEKAEKLRARVTAKFNGVISEQELLDLPVDDITASLNLCNDLISEGQPQQQKKPTIERHVEGLRRKGYNVAYGEKYLQKHPELR